MAPKRKGKKAQQEEPGPQGEPGGAAQAITQIEPATGGAQFQPPPQVSQQPLQVSQQPPPGFQIRPFRFKQPSQGFQQPSQGIQQPSQGIQQQFQGVKQQIPQHFQQQPPQHLQQQPRPDFHQKQSGIRAPPVQAPQVPQQSPWSAQGPSLDQPHMTQVPSQAEKVPQQKRKGKKPLDTEQTASSSAQQASVSIHPTSEQTPASAQKSSEQKPPLSQPPPTAQSKDGPSQAKGDEPSKKRKGKKAQPQQSLQTQPQQSQQPQPQVSQQTKPHPKKSGDGIKEMTQKTEQMTLSHGTLAIPARKSVGTKGTKCTVEVNLLTIQFKRNITITHYDVAFTPDVPKKLLPKAFEKLRSIHFPTRYPAFDGRKNLYALGKLKFSRGSTLRDTVSVFNEEAGKDKEFEIVVKEVNEISLDRLSDYMTNGSSTEIPQTSIQAMDIVLRQRPLQMTINAGRSFFTRPREYTDLGDGLELWRGFFQSAVIGWKPFLNIDVAHKGFPTCQNVIDYLRNNVNCNEMNLKNGLDRWQIDTWSKFIKGLKVVYQIPNRPETKRTYKVNGVSPSNACNAKFKPGEAATEITVDEYYARQKNTRIQYTKLNLLHVGHPSKNILLPAEFCSIAGGQTINRKLSEKQTACMVKAAAKPPSIRKSNIMQAIQSTSHGTDPYCAEFGITVKPQFERIDARVLDPPQIGYGNTVIRPRNGVWRADTAVFHSPKHLNSWILVNMSGLRQDNIANLVSLLRNTGKHLGMTISEPKICSIDSRDQRNVSIAAIVSFLDQEKRKCPDLQLVLIVMPDTVKNIYSRIKRASELELGIITQCLKNFTAFKKMNPATATNILLKINSKLRGINHALAYPPNAKPLVFTRPVMFVGADVTHPSPDQVEIPSIAAVSASYDPSAFRYHMEYRLQPPRVEIIQDLEGIMYNMLQKFQDKATRPPERIMFFRDGVSEGQFIQVLNSEFTAIRRACLKMYNGQHMPPVTFLVVQKRHHIRFFPTDDRFAEGKNGNVLPGTIIDSYITHPNELDFYLTSHASIQGTARPTKYHVLWDDASMTTDEIEEVTNHLCYLFARCNRAVSYPAPTYYAHLAAFRARAYMEERKLTATEMEKLDTGRHCGIVKDVVSCGSPMFFI